MAYSYPTDPTTFVDLLQWLQTIAPIGELILISIFIIAFLYQKRYVSQYALSTSFFLCAIVGTLMFILGIVDAYLVYFAILGTALSIFFIDSR